MASDLRIRWALPLRTRPCRDNWSYHALYLLTSSFCSPTTFSLHLSFSSTTLWVILCRESLERSRDLWRDRHLRATFLNSEETICSSSPSPFRYVQRNGPFISKAPTMLLLRLQVRAAMERWSQEMAMCEVRSCQPLGRGKSIYILNILRAI